MNAMTCFTLLVIIAVALAAPCLATEVITLPPEPGDSPLYVRPGDDYRLVFNAERELLEKWARDSKILDIFEGTQQIQLLIIARRLLGKRSSELR